MKTNSLFKAMLIFSICISILFMNTVPVFAEENMESIQEDGGYIDVNAPKTAYVFLGDSRCVGMDKFAHITNLPNVFVIARVGKGYDWLEKTALAELQALKMTTTYDKYVVICNLGVNDLGNINKYVSILPAFYAEDTVLYWVSVNPTIDSLSHVKCQTIEGFNATMQQFIPVTNWIDTYTYLVTDGFKAKDGVHYDADTYNKLFYYMMSQVMTLEYAKENPQPQNDSQQ